MKRVQHHLDMPAGGRDDAGFTLIEILVALIILSLAIVATVGAMATLSSTSGLTRLNANVNATARSTTETLLATSYSSCTTSGFPGAYQNAIPAPTITDPAANPPQKATIVAITDATGATTLWTPGGGVTCSLPNHPDPGTQLIKIQVATQDGSVTGTYWVVKSGAPRSASQTVPTVTTQPTTASQTVNSSNTDTITVTGTGTTTPTGTVHFYVCGPDASAQDCTLSSDNLTDLGTVNLPTCNGCTSVTATSSGYTATSAGTYCFLGAYQGDGNYQATSDGTSANECYSVSASAVQKLLLLATSGDKQLQLQGGHSLLTVTGTLMVDSTANGAVNLGAPLDLTATGGYGTAGTAATTCSGAGCTGITWTKTATVTDPLQLPAPSVPQNNGSCTHSGTVTTCTPGLYTKDPAVKGPALCPPGTTSVVLQSGTFVFQAGLTVQCNVSVTGSGVLLYVSGGAMQLDSTASVSLSPLSTTGTYANVAVFMSAADTQQLQLWTGTLASGITGIVYGPSTPVIVNNGGAGILSLKQVIASTFVLADHATVAITG